MGACTRPSHINRQWRLTCSALLAAVLFSTSSITPLHAAQQVSDPVQNALPDATASISSAAHEVAITVVEPGQESLSLSARLTNESLNLVQGVKWQVRDAAGVLVKEDTATEFSGPLQPGEYTVEAQYGAVSVRETVPLNAGNSVSVNFILNAGGLRVMSGLKGLPAADVPSRIFVYSLAGPLSGQLVAHTDIPGEVMKLPAGQYRVESRCGDGNAIAVTDVRIRPGRMSAVEVNHVAGLARLSYVGAPDATVQWDVRPLDGPALTTFSGISRNLALKPGTYVAEAVVNGEMLTARFRIAAGEERDILLGN